MLEAPVTRPADPAAAPAGAPLSVGLNLLYLVAESGGAGRYAHELIPALLAAEPATRITAFVNAEAPPSLTEAPWKGDVTFVRLPIHVTHGPPWNSVLTTGANWGALPALADRRRLDVVHGLANVVPVVSPRVPTVVTLLDLIWLRHAGAMSWRDALGMRLFAPASARRADRVIAISEAVRSDLVATLRLPAEKIDVTLLGVRAGDERARATTEVELRARLGLRDDPVVLCVAQKRAHKNQAGLIRALARLRDRRVRLVLPGAPSPYEDELRAAAHEVGVADRVHLPPWLSDADLEGLYRLATAFVLPSFEEGFGLPILEAMRRGVPVACSDASSLPEVAGGAALLFDPHDPGAIAAAVDRLLADPALRERLVTAGRERCRELTWERTARATLAVYRRAIAGSRRRR